MDKPSSKGPRPSRQAAVTAVRLSTSGWDGTGLRWAQVAHRVPDKRPGFSGRGACLRPHQSLDDPAEAQALDAQAVTHDLPSRNSSPSEAAARSLVPKVIALASATKVAGRAMVRDDDVVVASDVSSLLPPPHPAPSKAKRPSGTTCTFNHPATCRTVLPPTLVPCASYSVIGTSIVTSGGAVGPH